ncbi:MAG: hypothetical protein ACRBEE_07875 [Arenicella sp.]
MKRPYKIAYSAALLFSAISLHAHAASSTSDKSSAQFSAILDGRYASYDNDPEEYEIPGFSLGGEAELPEAGFSLGHIELGASGEIDDKLRGQLTVAIAEHDGETEVELEEAFIESLGLGYGFTARAGRFFPSIGRVNSQHNHAWDFIDAPLVYQGLWGAKYIDDGLRLSWIAPTDTFLEFGVEGLAASGFPAGGERSDGIDSQVLFMNIGGDINSSSSWQAGLSYHHADVVDREAGGHGHGHGEEEGEEESEETPSFSGDSDTIGINAVFKWSPNGNPKNRHLIIQGEYFQRDEDGSIVLEGSDPLEQTSINGDQSGFYLQGIYKFAPHWRAGIRYDRLDSDNTGSDTEVLEEAGLLNEGINPTRYSVMTEWVPSEFSRIRLQYNRDESSENKDSQLFLQFTTSIGAHGAHNF